MECHSCQHAGRIAALARLAFESTPCASCRLAEPSRGGRDTISLSSATSDPEHGQTFADVEAQASAIGFNGDLAHLGALFDDPDDAEEALSRAAAVVRELLRLPERRRGIVMARLVDPARPLRETAAELGISTQAAHQNLKAAERSVPALRAAFAPSHYRNFGDTCPQRGSRRAQPA